MSDQEQLLEHLRTLVANEHQAAYGSAGDAFAHVAVREYFDLDDEDALEYCDVGGSRDKGIDAIWFDDEDGRAVLVQSKWSEQPRSFKADVVREAEAGYRWLTRLSDGRGGTAAPRVVSAARRLRELRDAEPDYPVHIFVIVAGKFTPGAYDEHQRVIDDLSGQPAEMTLVPLSDLLEQVQDRLERDEGLAAPEPEVRLSLVAGNYFEHDGQPAALVATLNGRELAEAAETWGHHLFMRNLRYLIPGRPRGSVNAGIKRTLETSEGRERFWYYNNGIAIVCDRYELDDEADEVTVYNLQIVNGAQTTASLNLELEKLRNDPSPQLLARIIAEPDDELQQNITFYNNRQNAVKDRDLQSNDPIQDRLQREFARLRPAWFYERKRGEWNALSVEDAALKKRVQRRRVDNERAAQAAFAFYFDAAKARADKKNLFQLKKDGGYYEDIFNDARTAVGLLVPYKIAEHVRAEKNRYLKATRGIDPRKATTAQKRLLSRQWVKFADQFIVGAISFYLDMRGGRDEERLEELLGSDDFDEMVRAAYAMALRDLQPLFARLEKEAARRDDVFSAANYVKSNWEDVLGHLYAEWDAREAVGDPLEGVALLDEE
jgi:hypothetical protein